MKKTVPYLKHILQECEFLIENSSSLNFEEFVNNPVLSRAFVRSLEVIGEAVKKLPVEIRYKYPEVPWKNIAGMRDVLIHDYFGIKYEIVWKTVKERIPELKKQIEEILSKED